MSRTVLGLAALAWGGHCVMVVEVWRGGTDPARELRAPLLVGLIAGLLLVLALGWIGLYLDGTRRTLRDVAGASALPAELARRAAAAPATPVASLVLAFALGGGLFALVVERIGGRVGGALFVTLSLPALAAIAAVLARSWRLLSARDRLLAEIDRALPG